MVLSGVFSEEFEVENYPFDCQDLTISLDLGCPVTVARFEPIHSCPDVFLLDKTYLSISNWELVDFDLSFEDIDWSYAKTGIKSIDATVDTAYFRIQAKRKWFPICIRVICSIFVFFWASLRTVHCVHGA